MATDAQDVVQALKDGHSLAIADRVLINPEQGTLVSRVDALLSAMGSGGAPADRLCKTLIRLGMNFVGRDAEIVGYSADEAEAALGRVLSTIDGLEADVATAMAQVVAEFVSDMKSVNLADLSSRC